MAVAHRCAAGALLDDPDPAVRKAARESSWELDPEAVEAKLPSIGSLSKAHVLGTCALSPALVEQCFADDTVHPLAWNRHTPADAAARPDLGPDLVAELREDPDEDVRMRARLHPFPRTWAEYWAINRVIGHGPDCICPITEPATEPSPDWFAACAASEEPVLRRVAASWPGLPQNSSRHSHRMTTRRYGSGWPATTRWLRHTSSWTSLSPARPTVRTC